MYLSQLSLRDFRNYIQLDLDLGPGLFLFHGANAQGKTNLLEAVCLLATASSFHASNDREMVNWYAPEHVARINGTIQRRADRVQLEMLIFDPTPPTLPAPNTSSHSTYSEAMTANMPRKRLKVNGAGKRTMDMIGQMKVVLFAPTDLHLIDGPPDERRRFLDRALCQLSPRYCQTIVKYRKIVMQRAALLKRIRDNQEGPDMLSYLDEQLTLFASAIMQERQRMIDALTQEANTLQQAVSGGNEQLQIAYRPSFKLDPQWQATDIARHLQTQLREARKKEIMQGVCLLGPHRDELEFQVNGMNMLMYGSRGQQRTTALAAKLAELAFMRNSTGEEPVLLLDDVFSELDSSRREYLLCQVAQHEQVMLTTTDLSGFPADMLQRAQSFRVAMGTVSQEVTVPFEQSPPGASQE